MFGIFNVCQNISSYICNMQNNLSLNANFENDAIQQKKKKTKKVTQKVKKQKMEHLPL